ncbi:MAG: alpha/beta hydrolase [Gammaproteobacteria bacterium]|nr:alpha/beta hydrolase [Gammaproteobacteria bacterium]
MFSYENLQRVQPVSVTGAIRHSTLWLTASINDQIYPNPRFEPSPQNPLDPGIVIVCIHGTADRSSSFTLIAERLIGKLPPEISSMILFAFEQRLRGCGIEEFAEQVLLKLKSYNIKDVIFFGHSRGGLVAARFAEYLAQAANIRVHAVFTLGTPFNGSTLAMPPLSWVSNSVKQMQTESEFLKELDEKIAASLIDYFCLAGGRDSIVTDINACRPKANCRDFKIFHRHGHLSINSSHRVVEYLDIKINELIKKTLKKSTEKQSDNSKKSEELLSKIEDDTLEHQVILSDICYLIDMQITLLQIRHQADALKDKIAVLKKLLQLIVDILEHGKIEKYKDTYTLGGLINAFLHDKSAHNDEKPIDVLSKHLTLPDITFWREKPKSLRFIENLVEKLKYLSLPIASQASAVASSSAVTLEEKSHLPAVCAK